MATLVHLIRNEVSRNISPLHLFRWVLNWSWTSLGP